MVSPDPYLAAAIHDELARGDAHELGVDVVLDGEVVTVSGVVGSHEAHHLILGIVAATAPTLRIQDDVEVLAVLPPSDVERLT